MKTKAPVCVMTNGKRSIAGGDDDGGAGVAAGLAVDFDEVSGTEFRDGFARGAETSLAGTGGNTAGKNFSSFGANFGASSLVGNSMATNTLGRSVRVGQVANIRRDEANGSEFFFKKSMMAVNS